LYETRNDIKITNILWSLKIFTKLWYRFSNYLQTNHNSYSTSHFFCYSGTNFSYLRNRISQEFSSNLGLLSIEKAEVLRSLRYR
jgi:hypothetical protein